jgi:IS1 family transposase
MKVTTVRINMKINEVAGDQFKVYQLKVRTNIPGFAQQILTTTVAASNIEMARRLARTQFGDKASVYSISEIKPQGSQKR